LKNQPRVPGTVPLRRVAPVRGSTPADSFDHPAKPKKRFFMATVKFIEYEEPSPEVRDVYDDIMKTRQTDRVNNFWKALAVQPELLQRTWNSVPPYPF
jgi:hypothetical protein